MRDEGHLLGKINSWLNEFKPKRSELFRTLMQNINAKLDIEYKKVKK